MVVVVLAKRNADLARAIALNIDACAELVAASGPRAIHIATGTFTEVSRSRKKIQPDSAVITNIGPVAVSYRGSDTTPLY